MVSVTLASCYITSTSCYHPRYQSKSSMYIRGLIPRNFAELVEVVTIDRVHVLKYAKDSNKPLTCLFNKIVIVAETPVDGSVSHKL